MEKRSSKRVEFYQLSRDNELEPIWVFERGHGDSVLGLMLNISQNGAQILTSNIQTLEEKSYQLLVHVNNRAANDVLLGKIIQRWSEPEGSLYIRNGVEFECPIDTDNLISTFNGGIHWFRCELLALPD